MPGFCYFVLIYGMGFFFIVSVSPKEAPSIFINFSRMLFGRRKNFIMWLERFVIVEFISCVLPTFEVEVYFLYFGLRG